MPVSVVNVVHVLVVLHRLVAATRPVVVLMTRVGKMRQRVLVIVALVRRVRVTLVHVVDVPFSLHTRMTAAGAVLVTVVRVLVMIGGCHGSSQLCWTASATM
jgi:hypothetical protein